MEISLIRSPRTAVELFRMLPEGVLCEVIENSIYMSPAATHENQRVLRKLITQLDQYTVKKKLGEVFPAPIDVFLDENNAFQPDIIFLSNKNPGKLITRGGFEGVPDLVIEILSSYNKSHDLQTKKETYERVGVKEYWMVDPFTNEVTGYYLEKKSFKPFPRTKGKIKSKLLGKELNSDYSNFKVFSES